MGNRFKKFIEAVIIEQAQQNAPADAVKKINDTVDKKKTANDDDDDNDNSRVVNKSTGDAKNRTSSNNQPETKPKDPSTVVTNTPEQSKPTDKPTNKPEQQNKPVDNKPKPTDNKPADKPNDNKPADKPADNEPDTDIFGVGDDGDGGGSGSSKVGDAVSKAKTKIKQSVKDTAKKIPSAGKDAYTAIMTRLDAG